MMRKKTSALDSTSSEKILVVLYEDDVHPRFDLAMGLYIAEFDQKKTLVHEKTLVLPHPSAEDLCRLALAEKITILICGGIEEEYFDYLTWKDVQVIDSVIGDYQWALQRWMASLLQSGDIQRPA